MTDEDKHTIGGYDYTDAINKIVDMIDPSPTHFQKELKELISKHWKITGVDVPPIEIVLDILPARNGQLTIIIDAPKL